MKFSCSSVLAVTAVSLPVLVAAHNENFLRHHVRQADTFVATSSSIGTAVAPPSGTVPVPTSLPPGVSPPAATGSGAAASTTTGPDTTVLFTLQATNPTAIPVASITANMTSLPTIPLPSTATPAATPTYLPGAPPLPNAALLIPSNYPALDKPPPTDSPFVQQWIQQVQNSGISIPNISVTVAGGCPANLDAVADTSRCWWTCGGCTRNTDITACPDKLTWGLTYDDGPSFYTPNLMAYLDQTNLKSTFFVVGSRVISFPATLQAQYMDQHQIAVHTWSHPSLTTLTNEEIIAELAWSMKVIKDVIGVTPNIMRPPFGDIDDRVRAISMAMGLTPVMWTRISPLATFDTDDFNIHSGVTSIEQVLSNWDQILGNVTTIPTGFIVLEHDLFVESVSAAVGYILPDALSHQPPFTIKPVVQCMNLLISDAYIETNDNKTNPPPNPSVSSGSGSGSSSSSGTSSSAASAPVRAGSLPFLLPMLGLVAGVATIV